MANKISYNPDEEMMLIENDNGVVFHGNYWDFPRDPKSLERFLKKFGVEITIDKDLPAIG